MPIPLSKFAGINLGALRTHPTISHEVRSWFDRLTTNGVQAHHERNAALRDDLPIHRKPRTKRNDLLTHFRNCRFVMRILKHIGDEVTNQLRFGFFESTRGERR
jgi:hypothetical protein